MPTEIQKEIARLRKRVEWHNQRGRTSGTLDHVRLQQLLDLQKEKHDGKQNLPRHHSKG